MPREKPYAASHKGLRNALSQFSLLAGCTDPGDPGQVAHLRERGAELFTLMTHHLHTENRFLLSLLETRVAGGAAHDLADHAALEPVQTELAERLAAFDGTQTAEAGHDFYLAFTAFHGRYLGHIAHEERVTEPLLLAHFTDEELAATSAEIMKTVEPPVLLASLKFIVPAQSEPENTRLLRAFKASAPPAAFEALIETIGPELGAARLASLLQRASDPG